MLHVVIRPPVRALGKLALPRKTMETELLPNKSRVRASGAAVPGVGYDWLMMTIKPEMVIAVSLVFVGST
ncbi:unnamed protein product [Schistocephalus solidus]|uniref:Uncharacterized protein n=1 Tax=Schistocephalus solidus TaxID=70667 RepID=A0A183T0K7_SCHSO|nr:unnamed protein product [Schistocephalus solidus]